MLGLLGNCVWQRFSGWQQLQARLHVAQALGGERVGAQVGEAAAVVDTAGALQLVEHASKAAHIHTRFLQNAKTNAISLALHIAGEIELALRAHGLRPADHSAGGLWIFTSS